jgi:hypothetical protein
MRLTFVSPLLPVVLFAAGLSPNGLYSQSPPADKISVSTATRMFGFDLATRGFFLA